MRTIKTSTGLTINAIAGTHVVVLGLDLSDEKRKKCLGFAIQREDVTEGEKHWMSWMKTFRATDPLLGPGGQVSSHEHPFQSFDYSAKLNHDFTLTVFPLCGTQVNLRDNAFQPGLGALLPTLLGSLLLVALFLERVIEVFVSIWLDKESAVHEQNLDYWNARQARFEKDVINYISERDGQPSPDAAHRAVIEQNLQQKRTAIEEAETNADAESKALLPYQARTRKVTTWIGFEMGVLTAAVGFRFLAQIVVITPIIGSPQSAWFGVVDVLFSGAVLGGGSKVIHRIFSVYDAFMKTSQKNLVAQGSAR